MCYLDIWLLGIRECGSTLYVGLACAVPLTNTNFRLTFLLTDFMKTYLYRASNLKSTITFLAFVFIAEVNIWRPPKPSFIHNNHNYHNQALLQTGSDCRYRVIESSSLVPVLFREVFSHPYISLFHLLVNVFSVIIIIIIIKHFFRRVFSEFNEAITTSFIQIDAILPEIFAFIVGFRCTVWTKMRSLRAHKQPKLICLQW